MRRGGWREHARAELQAREGRLRGLRRLLERHEQLEAQQPGGGPPPHTPPTSPPQSEQQVAFRAELLRNAEAENREQRARLSCLARDLAALTRRHQEAECRAWTLGRENEELRAELSRARTLLREARDARLALETRWLREKALEAKRVNRAIEQEEKYRREVSRLQEKLAKARKGQPDYVEPNGSRRFSSSSQDKEATAATRGSEAAVEEEEASSYPADYLPWGDRA